jgi:hypothetical protein
VVLVDVSPKRDVLSEVTRLRAAGLRVSPTIDVPYPRDVEDLVQLATAGPDSAAIVTEFIETAIVRNMIEHGLEDA